MREYALVDRPHLFPQQCYLCGSQKGKFVDTFKEMGNGRTYVCAMCVKRMGVVMGLVKGDEYEKLMDAQNRFQQLEHEVEDRQDHIDSLSRKLENKDIEITSLNEQIEQLEGKVSMQQQALDEVRGRISAVPS